MRVLHAPAVGRVSAHAGARDDVARCRLLYLVGQLGPGGLERQLCYLLAAMDRALLQPAVAVWSFSESHLYVRTLRTLGIPIFSLPKGLSGTAKLVAFRRLVGRLRPELVHSYNFWTNFPAFCATVGTPALAIGSVRSDFAWAKREAGRVLGPLCALWPRAQILNSHAAAEAVRGCRGPLRPARIAVVPNGLDLARFPFPAELPPRPRIVAVGSLVPVKRWDRLIAAVARLRARGIDVELQIAGRGPEQQRLERQAAALGGNGWFRMLGHLSDIPILLSESTVLAHTADHEGCPNAVMEAMAAGRAVVATDAGDVPHLVDDGRSGFVVPRGDDAALEERLGTLIADRELCRRMGEAGRARAERLFGLDRLVDDTLAAYRASGWKESA